MQQSVTYGGLTLMRPITTYLPTTEEALCLPPILSLSFFFWLSLCLFSPALLQEMRERPTYSRATHAETQTRWGRLVCSFKFYFGVGAAAIETGRTAPYVLTVGRPTLVVRFTVDGTRPKFSQVLQSHNNLNT